MVYENGGWRVLNALPLEGDVHRRLMALPLAEDVIPLVPESELASYYGVSLEEYTDAFTLDQDGVGSCAWEATANCLMVTRWQQTGRFELLNPWTGYAQTNSRDVGSDPAENFQKCREVGLVLDKDWPRADHSWKSLPQNYKELAAGQRIDEIFRIGTRRELISVVGRRIPVNIGVNWGGGGHAITCVACLPDGVLIKNSWGADWNGGYRKPSYKILPWRQVDSGLDGFSCVACRSAVISGPAAAGMGQ